MCDKMRQLSERHSFAPCSGARVGLYQAGQICCMRLLGVNICYSFSLSNGCLSHLSPVDFSCVCVCVCVCVRDRERECVCVREGEKERKCVCVCLCYLMDTLPRGCVCVSLCLFLSFYVCVCVCVC